MDEGDIPPDRRADNYATSRAERQYWEQRRVSRENAPQPKEGGVIAFFEDCQRQGILYPFHNTDQARLDTYLRYFSPVIHFRGKSGGSLDLRRANPHSEVVSREIFRRIKLAQTLLAKR